ncbi:hypothetical protein [Nonomuraea wenchangensis]|uniref:hypothetical protein n=1 Tax=Nonomuraea wenchangensis TaxID=568860 RepID=UPI00332205EC
MPEPLTRERLEWIRRCNREDKARHGASWEDHGEPAERHRDLLIAEVDRLTARVAELTALLNDPDRLAGHLLDLRAVLSEADRDAEIDRLADGGDA